MRKTSGSALLVLFVLILALALTACGGSDNSSSSSTEAASTTTEETTEGNEGTEEEGAETSEAGTPEQEPEPTEIGITTPVSGKPPTGKTAILVECNLSICDDWNKAFEASAKALGWKSEILKFTQGAEPGGVVTQAIQKHPDYLLLNAISEALIKPQLAEAHKAGIGVIGCSVPEAPSPGGWDAMCLESLIPGTELATKWAIADSGEDAHILGVNIEESPALAEEIAWQEKEVSALCANCTFEELPVTFKDLEGGKVSSKVIAALQSNPEINYLYYGFGDIATGVPQALKGAGYADKVKQIGNNSTEAVIKELANGEQAAWANGGAGSLGATMIDPMVRLSLEEELTPEYLEELAVSPTYLVSSPEAAEALSSTEYTWPGPPDAVQQYEELWQLK